MEEKFKKAKRVICITAAILVLCTVLMWGIASGWGSVKIERVSIAGNEGTAMKAIQLVPRGVDQTNPAPVVLTNHGNTNSAYSELVFGLEFARRGYVVFLCDQPNAGESHIYGPDNAAANRSNVTFVESWIDYAHSQRYCDGRIIVTGVSRGGVTLGSIVNSDYVNKIDCAVNIVMSPTTKQLKLPIGANYVGIWADADASDFYAGASWVDGTDSRLAMVRAALNDASYEFGEIVGSFNDKTAIQFNVVRAVHPVNYLFTTVHSAMYSFVGQAVPTATTIAPDDLVFLNFVRISYVCAVLLICLGAQLAYLLAVAPGFRSVMMNNVPGVEKTGAKKRAIRILTDLLVPFVLFPIVAGYVKKANWLTPVFRCAAANPVIFWLLAVAVFGAIMIWIRSAKTRKTRSLTAADFGMGEAGDKIVDWKRIGNGAVIGVIATVFLFAWISAVVDITGINYSANAFAYLTRLTPERFVRGIPYILVIIPIVLVININIATTRRIPDSGRPNRDMIRDIAYNVSLSILPLTFLLGAYFVVGYMRGTGEGLFTGAWNTSMNQALGFPFMMGSSVGISTYLYRKTGNIWAGVFTSALVLGFFTMTPLSMSM